MTRLIITNNLAIIVNQGTEMGLGSLPHINCAELSHDDSNALAAKRVPGIAGRSQPVPGFYEHDLYEH